MKCYVNNIPLWFKPFFWLYSLFFGLLFYYLCFFILHLTCRIEFKGKENIRDHKNYILCIWHQFMPAYFTTFIRHQNHVWMNHPLWYMKPVHIFLRLIGIKKLILGSTGFGGKEAAAALVDELKKGHSTMVNPDGPHGPTRILKKGILHIAQQSGVPLVPVQFMTSHSFAVKSTWDQKIIPLPFAKIQVTYGRPIIVTKENFEMACKEVEKDMG